MRHTGYCAADKAAKGGVKQRQGWSASQDCKGDHVRKIRREYEDETAVRRIPFSPDIDRVCGTVKGET